MGEVRPIMAPFVVARPSGARIRTRLRPTATEERVLVAVCAHLGRLASGDLAARVRLGRVGVGGADRAGRKRALTAASSSRWAGAITRASQDQYELAVRGLAETAGGLRRAIQVISRRLAVPVGGRVGRVRGYATQAERFQKQRRVQVLRGRLAAVERRLAQGRPAVVRGGRRLASSRHRLTAAGLSEPVWRARWAAARWFATADGERRKRYGNETIRVSPDGLVQVKLPAPLAQLAMGGRLSLSVPVAFAHRRVEWEERVRTDLPVRYDLAYDPTRRRWYLDASWKLDRRPVPTLAQLRCGRVLAVDLNAEHLAGWVLDPSGNPIGPPVTVGLELAGLPTSTRDGRLRAAISQLLEAASIAGCTALVIEDLNFADARQVGRETMGRGRHGRRFRRAVAGIPTARFRDRLVAMAATRGLWVVAVDPAYTSRWGAQHWLAPLTIRTPPVRRSPTRHHAAAVVIGRRGLGFRARRRAGVTGLGPEDPSQRATAQAAVALPRPHAGGAAPSQPPRSPPGQQTRPAQTASTHPHGPKTVREPALPSAPT